MHARSTPTDTSSQVVALQVARWQEMSPAQRVALADQLSRDVRQLAIAGIRRQDPNATDAEVVRELIRRCYGDALLAEASRREHA